MRVQIALNQPFMNRSFATLHEKGRSLRVYSLWSLACQRSSGLGAVSPEISLAREPFGHHPMLPPVRRARRTDSFLCAVLPSRPEGGVMHVVYERCCGL